MHQPLEQPQSRAKRAPWAQRYQPLNPQGVSRFDGANKTRHEATPRLGSSQYHLKPPRRGIARPRSSGPKGEHSDKDDPAVVQGYLIERPSHSVTL